MGREDVRRLGVGLGLVVAFAAAACREGFWPSVTAADVGTTFYVAVLRPDGARHVARLTAGGRLDDLGLACDDASAVALAPDGARLLYGYDAALHEYDLKTRRDRVLASFPRGLAREVAANERGEKRVFSWDVSYCFRDIHFGPGGEVGFLLLSNSRAREERKLEEFPPAERASWQGRERFAADLGVYVVGASGAPAFVGYSRGFAGFDGPDYLLLEHRLALARYNRRTGEVTPLLPAGAYEPGWLPPTVVADGRVVVVAARAKKGSSVTVRNQVFILAGGKGKSKPAYVFEAAMPASAIALAPDGRYLAVQVTPRRLGEPAIYVVDLADRRSRMLAPGGRLLGFGAGSGAVAFIAGAGLAGDAYLLGLDRARARRLTMTTSVLPPP